MQAKLPAVTYDRTSESGFPSILPPVFSRADHDAPSLFRPENMLREARRQKGLAKGSVPRICILDPDGDLAELARNTPGARLSPHWACYHTRMWEWSDGGVEYGVVGHAVGGPFAVLVAEQLFVSGCDLLISVCSAGQIADQAERSYHILIDRALRDEGTSFHYLPAGSYVEAELELLALARRSLEDIDEPVLVGPTWTTDAPFRETEAAISARKSEGLLAVEMEAAALYAFAAAGKCNVLCLAHVTNQMGRDEGDFEKGPENGAKASMRLVKTITSAWLARQGAQ